MSSKPRSQLVLLAGLLLVLAGAVAYQLSGSDGVTPGIDNTTPRRTPAAGSPAATPELRVGLDLLEAVRPEPLPDRRNPFSFGVRGGPGAAVEPRSPALMPPPTVPVGRPAEPVVPGLADPPPPQPITLKFIGTVTAPAGVGRVAVLSDGKFVYHGREGDIIDGRYRLVQIGEESVQMEYLDGRGRQTIRLTGA